MRNGEQSGSAGRADGRVRLAASVGTGVGATLGQLIRLDLGGSFPRILAFVARAGTGAVSVQPHFCPRRARTSIFTTIRSASL